MHPTAAGASRHGPPRRGLRRLAVLLVVGAVACAGTVVAATPAQAAPNRTNNRTNAVYFVHGFAHEGKHNCREVWNPAIRSFRDRGWTGPLRTWGYYRNNTGCASNVNGNTHTPIREVGRRLSWEIFNRYTRHNRKADIVAHSMGGLVARAAIHGVRTGAAGFPPRLYVEDVITLSTPHTGTSWATSCYIALGHGQCRDMSPSSGFLRWVGRNPQSTIGTDWTLVGAADDDMVTGGSATGMRAGHKIVYCGGQGLEHHRIMKLTTGNRWCQRIRHHHTPRWVSIRSHSPIGRAFVGARFWSAQ